VRGAGVARGVCAGRGVCVRGAGVCVCEGGRGEGAGGGQVCVCVCVRGMGGKLSQLSSQNIRASPPPKQPFSVACMCAVLFYLPRPPPPTKYPVSSSILCNSSNSTVAGHHDEHA
jgi:hypothetical protein